MKHIYVVRHCKAEGQAADASLTGAGMQQALVLAELLSHRPIGHIISSPYERAYRTIQPLAERLRLQVAFDDRLSERVLSVPGHPEWRERLRQTFDDPDLCYEGGESSRAAMSRAAAVVREVLTGAHAHTVLVSHGNLISLLLKYYDDRVGFAEWEALSNPDVFHLAFEEGPPVIRRIWPQ